LLSGATRPDTPHGGAVEKRNPARAHCGDAATGQGLALPALAKDAWEMPAFFRMVQQGLLRDPVFSVWLDPDPNAVPAGEVLFGGAEPSHFQPPLHFISVISKK
jgi:hypothetical protein